MKSFLKYTLATIVGIIIVNAFIFFIFISFIGIFAGLYEQPFNVKENTVLHLTFNSPIPDKASTNPLDNMNILSLTPTKQIGLNKILAYIKEAKTDQRISGIYLDLSDINSNFGALATVEEIREALLDFKKSGKFIYSYSTMGYSQKSYYLATVADSIFVNPESPLLLTGMSASISFYKETLEKLGLQPEIFRVGKFKSAIEPYISTEISEANREQVQTYLNSLWGNIVKGISSTRGISEERINQLTDNFQIYSPEEFTREGFFDGAIYQSEMLEKLKQACGLKTSEEIRFASLAEYMNGTVLPFSVTPNKIAVIYAQGDIGMQQTAESIGPELADTIRKARKDDRIKAIVLRVNSPGGSALTSDIIWKEVQLAAQTKPVIVSMGNVAASGGYYISCAATTILAEPTTLTGSIGIFGLMFSGEKLIKDKMGITTSTVNTNEHSDFGGSYPLPVPISNRPMTEYEKGVMQAYINRGYDTFLSRVSEGRHMSKEEVHEIAQGRVWTGEDALRIGLVDQLGGLNEAIQLAAEKAGLSDFQIIELPGDKNPLEEILGSFSTSIKERIIKEELEEWYEIYKGQQNILNNQGAVARIPYNITFN